MKELNQPPVHTRSPSPTTKPDNYRIEKVTMGDMSVRFKPQQWIESLDGAGYKGFTDWDRSNCYGNYVDQAYPTYKEALAVIDEDRAKKLAQTTIKTEYLPIS